VRRILVLGAVVASLLAWNVSTSWAGAPGILVDPTSGPPGTVVHVESTSFACGDGGGGDVHVGLFAPDDDEVPVAEAETTSLDETPEWAVDLTVPNDATPGEYTVVAVCFYNEQSFRYIPGNFTVTAVAPTTTTSTTTTTVEAQASTTTTTTVPVAPTAEPAAPVVASPALTG
jgi:hypothetical protein